eukprot:1625454-Prymnesium_polylepis.1
MQNDDHAFVEPTMAYFKNAVEAMRRHRALFKPMWISHWAEGMFGLGVRASAAANSSAPALVAPGMLRTEVTAPESFQIWNAAYMNYVFIDLSWDDMGFRANPRGYWRTDDAFTALGLSLGPFSGTANKALQTVFIPLREQFRKFDGYSARWVEGWQELQPPLELPPSRNRYYASHAALSHALDGTKRAKVSPLNLRPEDGGGQLSLEWRNAIVLAHREYAYPFGRNMSDAAVSY